jgi:glycosyltransferase involved in cell wall biosynthesis
MRLSIVLPTMPERGELFRNCIRCIEECTTDYELILLDYPGMFTEKLNEGIRRAQGDYIAYLHDDCEVLPGWADVLADAGVFCTGEVESVGAATQWYWGGVWCDWNTHWNNTDPNTPVLNATFWELSREVAQKVAPFDTSHAEGGNGTIFQNLDLGMVLIQAGYILEPLPGKIVHNQSSVLRLSTHPKAHEELQHRVSQIRFWKAG